MRKMIVTATIVLGMMVLVLDGAIPAGAAKFARVHFGASSVMLIVPSPTPACRPTHGTTSCQWTLLVTQDATKAVVGQATGTAGVLTVTYPTTCGPISAAVLVGPPMRREVHFGHTITAPCSAPVPGPSQMATPGGAAANPGKGAGTANLAGASDTSLEVQSAAAAQTQPSQLPFTGAPILDLLATGFACLILAAWCLAPGRSRLRPSVAAVTLLAPVSGDDSIR